MELFRKWHRLIGVMILLLLSSFAFAQQPPVHLPEGITYVTSVEGINEYRLENGLRVLLFPDLTKATVTVNATYLVGSRHEDYGETGMAHLLEHLMFKGSKNHPDIPKELQDHGASPNGSTGYDRTNYFETFQATEENMKWALSLESDRMVNAFIARKDLDSEMTVVRNEFESGENNPRSILMQRTMSAAYLWHNYGNTVIGSRSDIENVPIERLQGFYRHFYQPDNAILIVAGKLDEKETLDLIHHYFSPIPRPTRKLRQTYTVEPTQDGERSVTLRRVGDVQYICVIYHIPAGSHEKFVPVEIAAQILGDVPGGRLHKALVETGKAASTSAATFRLKDPGAMIAFASVRKEQSLDDALKTMLDTISEIQSKPFTETEVNRSKTQHMKAFDMLMNNSERVALYLSEWQAMGDWRLMFLNRDRVNNVTRDQIQQAAEKYFIPSNRTIGRFIPDDSSLRAEIPSTPDVAVMLKDYKSHTSIAKGEAFDPSPENIENRTLMVDLENGLKLSLLSKETRGNKFYGMINLHFGNEKSLKGLSTAGMMTGQMLMRGTKNHTRQEIKDEFDRLKAQVMISGGPTGASVTIQGERENLKPVLDLVSEILRSPAFPEDEFEQLKQQQLAALENQKSQPQSAAMIAMQRHMRPYPKGDVRYVPTIDERIEEIKNLNLDNVRSFYDSFYGASHGEVALVGDFEPKSAQMQINHLFNDWESPAPYERVKNTYRTIEPTSEAIEIPDKANALWTTGYAFPMTDEDPDYAAMTFASYMFGSSGFNSRLFARIRGKEGLSYSVGGRFTAGPEDNAATFMAMAICAPQNVDRVETAFKDELAKFVGKGFSAEEIAAAKKSWIQSQEVWLSQDQNIAAVLIGNRFWNRSMDFQTRLRKEIADLTSAQILETIQRYIEPSQFSYFKAGSFK